MLTSLIAVACGAAAFLIGWFGQASITRKKIGAVEERSRQILEAADREANSLKKEKLIEVKDEWIKKRQDLDNEFNSRQRKIQNVERQLTSKEENLDRKAESLRQQEKSLRTLESDVREKTRVVQSKEAEAERLVQLQTEKLEKLAGVSRDDAKKMLIENLKNEARSEASLEIREIREKARMESKKEAQKVIVQAIQRTAADHSVETTVSVVSLPNEEMKGRIIGREGRNIRSFEAATGCDIIVDDTPDAVVISGFDPFRREIAKIALERLITDGRIHPTKIEEVVEKVRGELDEEIVQIGEDALLEVGIHGVHPEIVKLLGRMKYRSSYGQNVLQHSIEVAFLSGLMAVEIGLDATLAKRAGLFHDLGKVVDKNVEGPHALLGFEIAKKFGENPVVANAIGSHHEDIEMESPIAAIVQSADAISGARPGARRESLEGYVKRLEKLEGIANSFSGVGKTYAIQAGREVRVIVEPEKVNDMFADQLAHEISQKIQEQMEYPGQIKVTVIREVRSIAYAK
ncbi:MAG TPA: ribonuclease Y [Candidatus Kryptonia bacterium]